MLKVVEKNDFGRLPADWPGKYEYFRHLQYDWKSSENDILVFTDLAQEASTSVMYAVRFYFIYSTVGVGKKKNLLPKTIKSIKKPKMEKVVKQLSDLKVMDGAIK